MTLAPDEFIRRFLLHVLPKGFHRIRRYGLLASATCKKNIARARELIAMPVPVTDPPVERNEADPAAGAAARAGQSARLCGDCRARRYPSNSSGDGARRAQAWFRTRRAGRSADCIGRQTR